MQVKSHPLLARDHPVASHHRERKIQVLAGSPGPTCPHLSITSLTPSETPGGRARAFGHGHFNLNPGHAWYNYDE